MPWTYYPAFIRGLYFADDETHHRFLTDMDAGLCDPDELETWLCWPRVPPPKTQFATSSSKLEHVAAAAKRTGVSRKRIREWVSDGKLKCVRFENRTNATMNIVASDLDRLIDGLVDGV